MITVSTYNTRCIFNKYVHVYKVQPYSREMILIFHTSAMDLNFDFFHVSDVGPFLVLIMHTRLGYERFFLGFVWSVTGDDSRHLVENGS